jgi:hypothetical protein
MTTSEQPTVDVWAALYAAAAALGDVEAAEHAVKALAVQEGRP